MALYPLIHSESLGIWALVISAIFLLLAFIAPSIFTFPNKLWFKFGILLGSIVAPNIMALI